MLHGVIMAGGSGTRFWPQSRQHKPKQLLNIVGNKTMIRATAERILPEIPFDRITVVTGISHAEEIAEQLPELNPGMIVSEPYGRNTAPCIALAAYKLFKIDPDGIMVVLPSDHLIGKEMEFRQSLRSGAEAASRGDYLITFGIVPHRPETGYGYIHIGSPELQIDDATAFKVQQFVEKPNRATAEKYVASGRYLWNSGMFVWKISSVLKAFETYLPNIDRLMKQILPALNTPDESAAISEAYEIVDSISIDYGIMEKADNVLTIPVDVEWNDVGCWTSLGEVWESDDLGNSPKGLVVMIDSERCIVSSPYKLTAVIGVEDLIVVDTPDALMICRKDSAQHVGKIQEILKEKGLEDLL